MDEIERRGSDLRRGGGFQEKKLKPSAAFLGQSSIPQPRDQLARQALCAALREREVQIMDVDVAAQRAVEGRERRPALTPALVLVAFHRASDVVSTALSHATA